MKKHSKPKIAQDEQPWILETLNQCTAVIYGVKFNFYCIVNQMFYSGIYRGSSSWTQKQWYAAS